MNQEMQAAPGGTKLCIVALLGFIFSFFCGIAGLIMSIIGIVQIGKSNGALTGKGFAIAGIIIGAIMFIFQVIWGIAAASGGIHL